MCLRTLAIVPGCMKRCNVSFHMGMFCSSPVHRFRSRRLNGIYLCRCEHCKRKFCHKVCRTSMDLLNIALIPCYSCSGILTTISLNKVGTSLNDTPPCKRANMIHTFCCIQCRSSNFWRYIVVVEVLVCHSSI